MFILFLPDDVNYKYPLQCEVEEGIRWGKIITNNLNQKCIDL